MRAFISYFIKYPIASNLLMFSILIAGGLGLLRMKSTFFPLIPDRNIQVQAVYPGASPEEIEEGIILKIEENLKGTTGIERITSISNENQGIVTIQILKGYDIDLVLQDVKNAVDRISSFPSGMEPPTIFKQEGRDFAIGFALSGEVSLKALKTKAYQVEDELLALDGISKIDLGGFPDEEIEIAFREKDLRNYQITFAQAAAAVRATNLLSTGGIIKGQQEELLIRAKNREYYAEDLKDIPIKNTPSGGVVYLRDVADINDKWADNPNRNYLDNKASVIVSVRYTNSEDILNVTNKVKEYIKTFNQKNDVIKAKITRDGSVSLRQRIGLLTENGLIGFFLVLVLLALFLNWRLAFWVAIAIPISFAGVFIIAPELGETINVITLFGMILVIGILVDDGIVICENIYSQSEKGVPRFKAAVDGTMQVLPAVFTAIVTTCIAFSSFYFLDGTLGDFFSSMATIVSLALVFSLIEGALILPAHVAHSAALNPNRKVNPITKALDNALLFLRNKMYAPILRLALRYKIITMVIMIGLLMLTIGAIQGGKIRGTFFPVIPSDFVNVTLKLPAGTRAEITDSLLLGIENAAWEASDELKEKYKMDTLNPIEKIERIIGPTTYEGRLSINLLDSERRKLISQEEITSLIRKKVGVIPSAETLSFDNPSPFGKAVDVSLLGTDYKLLSLAVEDFKQELGQMEGLRDINDNNQSGLREVNISLKSKAEFLGVSLQEIMTQVRQGFFGAEIQRLQRGRDEVKVWVRYEQSNRNSVKRLGDMRIQTPSGASYPLRELASYNIERGVIAINHLNGKREIKVQAALANSKASAADLNTTISQELMPKISSKYPGVSFDYSGQKLEQQKTTNSISSVLPPILGLMFLCIALTFRSLSQAGIVFFLIPFCFIGVGWGHYIMDKPISLLSFLGVIALIGILVNDALVFIAAYNDNIKSKEMTQDEALYDASLSRFRPIVLTSVTTIAGLVPLMQEQSFQAQFLIPMAISVSYGLALITVIILIMLPILLHLSNRLKVYSIFMVTGKRLNNIEVEPHYEGRKVGTSGFFIWLIGGLVVLAWIVGFAYLISYIVNML